MTLGTSPLLTPSLLVPPASPHRLQQQMSSRVQSQGQTWPRRAETAHDTRARGGKPHHFIDTEGPDHRRSPGVYALQAGAGARQRQGQRQRPKDAPRGATRPDLWSALGRPGGGRGPIGWGFDQLGGGSHSRIRPQKLTEVFTLCLLTMLWGRV